MDARFTNALWYSALTQLDLASDAVLDRALVQGNGCFLHDRSGRGYLDARSGLWNVTLGYGNQRIIAAIKDQLDRLPVAQIIRHDQPTEIALDYAERLVTVLPEPLAHVRLCTTAAQAVEGAVFLSRFVRKLHGEPGRTGVLAFHNGYHGTGGLATHLSGEPWMHELQEPLVPGVHHVEPWDLEALRQTIEQIGAERLTAFVLEPVLGTDILAAPHGYLKEAQRLCAELGIHFILDEVTSGFGRTGVIAETVRLGLRPDMLILSKGITSGYAPLAAIATTRPILEKALARPGVVFPHGSTADGHPLSVAAAMAVLDELENGRIFRNVVDRGEELRERITALRDDVPLIWDVRGPGLMIGVELRDAERRPLPAQTMQELKLAARDAGVLLSISNTTVIFTPPLVISSEECDQLVSVLEACIRPIADHRPPVVARR
jgi:adenosylmethionine-8-amino-7-oxononanoate aminotransferase